MSEETQPGKIGRPSKYKPEYDEKILELADSKNMWRIAAIFEVCMDTLDEWRRAHPSFSEAYRRARELQMARLFEKGEAGLDNRNFNAQGFAMLCKHEFQLSDQRSRAIKGISKGTLTDRAKAILVDSEAGNLTPDELNKSVSAIAIVAKIDEITEQREKMEKMQVQLDERNK